MARRASRTSNKREDVLRIAAKLFRERGYHPTRMEDVAAGVQLDKGTLYHYFSSKSDLLYEIFAESIEIAQSVVAELSESRDAAHAIERFISFQLQTIAIRPNESAVYFQESRYLDQWLPVPQVKAIRAGEAIISTALTSAVERGCRSGAFVAVDARTAAQGIVGMCAWVSSWYRPRTDLPLEEVGAQFSRILLNGLRCGGDQIELDSPA